MTSGPRRISDRERSICIDGYFMPTDSPKVPALIAMPGIDDLFVFVFSTEEKLVAAMGVLGIEYAGVAHVPNGIELFGEIAVMNARGERPYRIRLAVDPYKADNGRIRYVEVAVQEGPILDSATCSTTPHADGCQVAFKNGIPVSMCVSDCPALVEFLASSLKEG